MRQSSLRLIGLAIIATLVTYEMPATAAQPTSIAHVEALRSLAKSEGKIAPVYESRGYRPIWFNGNRLSAAGAQLLDMIEWADLDDLDPDDYRPGRLREWVEAARAGDEEDVARAEMAINRALFAYSRDLHRKAKSDLTYVDKALRPTVPSPALMLRSAADGASIDQIIQMHPLYVQLRRGYANWREKWANVPDVPIQRGAVLASGAKGERVRLLRSRLGMPAGTVFDAKVAAQVRAFKEAYGLPATPVVDDQTVAALNERRGVIDARIQLNLARARVLPAPAIGRHLVVDAAGQRLMLYDGGRLVDSMKVIVGKPSEPTPMMAALMRYITVNPYWNVPPDLAANRVAQGVLKEGLGYLAAKNYEVLSDWSTQAERLDPATIDWQAVADGRRTLRVRQLPGPGNMMGAMKFMFPNKFGVYLHDTPEKVLFKEGDRRRSSGCVRVEDAPRLARWLYGSVPAAPNKTSEYNVPLAEPIPVFITYLTAAPTPTGIAFREDVYGRDRLAGTRMALASDRPAG